MAGDGSRFSQLGYTFPKPLIDVEGKPMIHHVIENVDIIGDIDAYIFLVRDEHRKKYNLDTLLNKITSNRAIIVPVEQKTDGAARTALLAKAALEQIASGSIYDELLIANSDQIIEYSKENFRLMKSVDRNPPDGIIFSFNSSHPKWSFIALDNKDQVIKVAEKDPISNIATTGHYYFKSADLFFWAAEKMIEKNIRTNNEFYIAPCYNELISANCEIHPFFVHKMWSLGTPEDLESYLGRK